MGSQKKVQRRTSQASLNTELEFGGAAGSDLDQEEVVDERAVQDVESLSSLIQEILDFDQAQQIKCFNSKLFLCNICFCEKLGSECMYFLECRHVYCKACLKDYFEIQIRDGQVQCLNCPEPKCPSVATPGQVTIYSAASCLLILFHKGRHVRNFHRRAHQGSLRPLSQPINCFTLSIKNAMVFLYCLSKRKCFLCWPRNGWSQQG